MAEGTTFEYVNKYSEMSKNEFRELILMGKPKTRCELVNFILNTLHNINASNFQYCHCEHLEDEKCKMCVIPKIFVDFEKDIENNLFDYNFLFFY